MSDICTEVWKLTVSHCPPFCETILFDSLKNFTLVKVSSKVPLPSVKSIPYSTAEYSLFYSYIRAAREPSNWCDFYATHNSRGSKLFSFVRPTLCPIPIIWSKFTQFLIVNHAFGQGLYKSLSISGNVTSSRIYGVRYFMGTFISPVTSWFE